MFIRAPQLGQVPRLASPKNPGNEEKERSGLLEAHPEGINVILRAEESGLGEMLHSAWKSSRDAKDEHSLSFI